MITIVLAIIATMLYSLFGVLVVFSYLLSTDNRSKAKVILTFILWPFMLIYLANHEASSKDRR